MADLPTQALDSTSQAGGIESRGEREFYTFSELLTLLRRRGWFFSGITAGFFLLCTLYCLVTPNRYEATARVALRTQPNSPLSFETAPSISPASILSTPLQLETIADVFKSERLAWRVMLVTRLWESPGFVRNFQHRFPRFDPSRPTPEAQSYLLERFAKDLRVKTLPRTLLIQIDFLSKDPTLAATVVNALTQEYGQLEVQSHREATSRDTGWLEGQLRQLTAQVELKEKRLVDFEHTHSFLTSQQSTQDGQRIDTLHDPSIERVEEVSRQLVAASGDRILREALYREAQAGNPEQVLMANPGLLAELGGGPMSSAQQLRNRSSELTLELVQLKSEFGPNFPRVLELERASSDLVRQLSDADRNLVESFQRGWLSAQNRENLLRQQLEQNMAQGLKQNDALLQYSVLHEEAVADRSLCTRMETRIREAALAAGVHGINITVVDAARVPFKPVSPNWQLSFGIALVLGLLFAFGGAVFMERRNGNLPRVGRTGTAALMTVLLLIGLPVAARSQAPTPSTSGLPSGVVRIPLEAPSTTTRPNPKEAPMTWNGAPIGAPFNVSESGMRAATASMALPIGPGDFLEVGEFHVPEFRSAARVDGDGSVLLPMVGKIRLQGLTENQASAAIEKALLGGGFLLHPHVSVLIVSAVGQDVSVMGEVTRPGVYAYTAHHRLLDLISAASGLAPNAGRLVTVVHREDPHTAHAIVLDPSGMETKSDHNPELFPGDTVLVSRAGLVYVIGDVVRPGGFAVDPVQGLTIVQALSLAWGSTPNASVTKAILIRDQPGGRTLTTLNLRRMIRGQDPDQPVRDRDILFVPDSATKNLMNKTLESAIQSAIGVTIYAGLVYSQRF